MEKEKEMKGAFVERDLSWMYFNHRILQEAEKKNVPILERMSFLDVPIATAPSERRFAAAASGFAKVSSTSIR